MGAVKRVRDWIWDGGRASVDLLNTLRNRKETPRECLREPEDLADWLARAGLLAEPARVSSRHLARARMLRDAIDRVALAAAGQGRVDAADVATLNDFARVRASPPELLFERNTLKLRVAREKDPVAVALGAIAADAIDLVTQRPEGLHICASDTCGVRFEDRSPAGNRQWCSMKRCGNREKARLHYWRQK